MHNEIRNNTSGGRVIARKMAIGLIVLISVPIIVISCCALTRFPPQIFGKDDMVLELAVTAGCDYILTYNVNDFKGSEKFGIEAITPKAFLEMVVEL